MPFNAMRLRSALWTPASLALPIWSISDDPGNTVVSGSVNTIINKGSAGNATANTAGRNNQATLNGRAVLTGDATFDGYYTYGSSMTQWKNKGFIYLFAVSAMRVAEVAASTKTLVSISRPTSNGTMAEIARNPTTPNSFRAGGRRITTDTFASTSNSVDYGTSWKICVAELDYTNGDIFLYLDGTLVSSNTTDLTSGSTANTDSIAGVTIGALNNGTNLNENYHLAEWGCGNAILAAADRQRLEGYLAHRWGLTGNLPGGHPYKTAPP